MGLPEELGKTNKTKSMGRANKTKGSNAEREYAKFFRELGFKFCVTSRFGSKLHDGAKIDLLNVPFNVQIKAGKQKGINYSKILSEIAEAIKVTFPPTNVEHTLPNIVIHKKFIGAGRKKNPFDEIVCLSLEDFKKIISPEFSELLNRTRE